MTQESLENIPNAGRLMLALRSTGYNNISAIADLIDNSIDAGAQRVDVSLRLDEGKLDNSEIIVADNGSGMNWETLRQAMRLGSDVFHNLNTDLGKYGMGLVTASISIGRRLTVITRNDGITNVAIQDLDEIMAENRFVVTIRPATPEESERFDELTRSAKSGTAVIIGSCDHIQYSSEAEMARELENEVGRIFRLFLRDSSHDIFINKNRANLNDPLWLDDERTTRLLDEDVEITVRDMIHTIHLRATLVPFFNKQTNSACGFNMRNQGFYLMRNHREIASGITLGVFKKHNDLNRMRIELEFGSELDDEMGISFTKRDAKPSKIIVEQIQMITNDLISQALRSVHDEQTERRLQRIEEKRAKVEERLEEKAAENQDKAPGALQNPTLPGIGTSPAGPGENGANPTDLSAADSANAASQATNASNRSSLPGPRPVQLEYIFEERSFADNDPFDIVVTGSRCTVCYNTASDFYQKRVQPLLDADVSRDTVDFVLQAALQAPRTAQLDEAASKAFNQTLLKLLQED